MIVIIFMMLITILLTLNFVYFYYKLKKALLVYQQGGYSNVRFLNYIKKNYKYVYGINELLLIVIAWLCIYSPLFLLLLIFISYYNLRFYNLNEMKFKKKLGLKITSRIKRLIITLLILLISILVCTFICLNKNNIEYNIFLIGYYSIFILLIYLLFVFVMISNFINSPIEKGIKTFYKIKAQKKLKECNPIVIGITGSYGKTSTKNILYELLSIYAPTLKSPESYNTVPGLCITIEQHLNKWHKYFIAEMGAYKNQEIEELTKLVSPKIGIISNVGPQHLETFKTIDNIIKTKMELIENLPNDGLAVLNYDNELIKKYSIKNNVKVKWYSLFDKNADIYVEEIKYLSNGMSYIICYKNKKYDVKTKLLGKYNITNTLAALLVIDHFGYDIELAITRLTKLKPIKHRLELKQINANTTIIDDAFNGNVEGIKESIEILSKYDQTKRILITPGLIDLGNKQEVIHNEIGAYLNEKVDELYIIGNYNKDAILAGINDEKIKVKCKDNFIDAYYDIINKEENKTILIANDLPDKFN